MSYRGSRPGAYRRIPWTPTRQLARAVLVLHDANLIAPRDGEALRQINGRWPRVRCLVLVHSVEQERLARAAGADAVLQAGFRAEVLFETIRSLTGSARSHSRGVWRRATCRC